ncbi:hypothetical protein ACQ4M3_07495 [Leptolyngbya sp. AN03gr2]|uniref:hypothetical protein n=1 Tax=unclassified Leptolyngbya TaxID=2650499 RepID=UPI003D31BEFF
MTYQSFITWYINEFDVTVYIPGFSSYETAKQFGNQAFDLSLCDRNGKLCLLLTPLTPDGTPIEFERSQVSFRVDTKASQRIPLDPRDPDQLQQIIDALDDPNSIYSMNEEDLQVVDLGFEELAARFKLPVRFSSLSYGVLEQI